MKKALILIVCVFFLSSLLYSPKSTHAAIIGTPEENLQNLNRSINEGNWANSAVYSTRLAEYYDKVMYQYDKAVPFYEDAAKYWAKDGHPDWGVQYTQRAEEIRTELVLYVEKPVTVNRPLAKFEPTSGTYIGLFLNGIKDGGNADPSLVEGNYGRNHAMYLTYTHWNMWYPGLQSYFRTDLAEKAKEQGAALQVAWEPLGGLDQVVDNDYVREFAREARETGIPIFLRFAGEMNGDWVPWYGDPEKYKEKFRLIHDIMEVEAPNVAMVWSPNFFPYDNIDPYYPGDEYVDWVGTSLYMFPYTQGKENLGGNPIGYLKPIYEKYSHKPIMISEGAAAHEDHDDNRDYSKWAVGQIGNMYGFLPRMFPQLKAITYFNSNNESTTEYDKQPNNYDLGTDPVIESTYERLIQSPYLLDTLVLGETNDRVQTEYAQLETFKKLTDVRNAFVYTKLPLGQQPYYVAVYQGGTKLGESYTLPWDMQIDFSLVDKAKPLSLRAFDKDFNYLATREVKIHSIGTYNDVPVGHYAEDAIDYLVDRDIINGIGNNNFGMGQPLTRWQAAVLISRANKLSITNRPDPGFSDVPQGYPYYKEIAAVVNEGLFNGVTENTFNPDATLTRSQMAVVLQRLYEFPNAATGHPFTDITENWYADAVSKLYAARITGGVSETKFGPGQTVTREQFAVFLARSMDESFR